MLSSVCSFARLPLQPLQLADHGWIGETSAEFAALPTRVERDAAVLAGSKNCRGTDVCLLPVRLRRRAHAVIIQNGGVWTPGWRHARGAPGLGGVPGRGVVVRARAPETTHRHR